MHRPVMIHRAPFGSMERFVAILIEHTAGNFPLWLTPTQVQLLCVSEKHEKYAQKVSEFLENNEIRALVDNRSETIGKKIREAEMSKVPFMGIIGEQEAAQETVSIREHGGKDLGTLSLRDFAALVESRQAAEIKVFETN